MSVIIEQSEIHEMVHSEDVDERRKGLNQLCENFIEFPNNLLAWNDLIQLVQDEDRHVRENAAEALMDVSHDVSDKEQAWQDLTRLTQDENSIVRALSTSAIGNIFSGLSDKEQAWKDLHSYSLDDDTYVRSGTAFAIVFAFHDIPNKKQAWDDLIRLAWDKEIHVKGSVSTAIMLGFDKTHGSFFSSVPDKVVAWKDLIRLIKDNDLIIQNHIANAIFHIFPNIPDKNLVWKDLISLVKDKNIFFRLSASIALGSSFPHMSNKELAWNDLIILAKDKNEDVRIVSAYTFSHLAKYYRGEKAYKKTSECFNEAASAFRFGFREHIKPTSDFYLFMGLSSYYLGKALIDELPDIRDPERYIKNLQNAIGFFNKSINFIKKSSTIEYETERCCFHICLNIYSALYEYNLSLLELDDKRIKKIENYLDEASNQCTVVGNEDGVKIVKIIRKLSEALRDCIEEVKLESKKQEAIKKGKGIGYGARYMTFIDKSRKNVESHFTEIDDLLNQLEAPIFTKIAEIEKENLKNLKPRELENGLLPKSLWQLSYEFIKKIWKFIAAVIFILGSIATIMIYLK